LQWKKNDLTTRAWQHDIGCPISIVLLSTSDAATHQVDTIDCTGPNSVNGVSGLIGRISLVGRITLSDLSGISNLISHNGLINFIGHNGLVDCIGIVTLAGLIGHISLAGLIGDISFIGSFVGFVGFGLISLGGIISDISLVSFICLSFVSLVGFISLFGYIGLIGRIGHNSLAGVGLSLVSLLGLSIHWPFKLGTHRVAIKQPSVTGITKVIMQAAHGVATVSSATRITNAAIWYYCIASHSFARESLLSQHVLLLTGGHNSVFKNALQNATQLFFDRIPQMTKYCIMRECENIHSWISLSGDLVFSHQQGIYGFKFPKRFFGDLFQRSHFFSSSANLKT
jgi:hypothetical protein